MARNRASMWQRWRKKTPKARIEADKAMVNAIREAFGMAPLYGPDPLEKADEERFGNRIYLETQGQGGHRRFEIGS